MIHGHAIRYSTANRTMRLDSASAPLNIPESGLRLRILVDRSSIEVFADQGQVTLSAITLENPSQDVTLVADGGGMTVTTLEANRLESIWTNVELR
jgi:fructan beta-fructosidase